MVFRHRQEQQSEIPSIRQQEQIDLLIRELTHLRQQASEPATARNLRDELPPHY